MSIQEIKPSASGRVPTRRSFFISTPAPRPARAHASNDFSSHLTLETNSLGKLKDELIDIAAMKPIIKRGTIGGSFAF
jgi:hypothetical protein